MLIVILLRRPSGLIPEKPSLTMAKASLKQIADSTREQKEPQKESVESR
jgi:hypothetical protein